ncbi:MAG: response regulator [Bacteroidetes bacterium]|nr:response regulator [Bacteroidota bacterium]
MVEIRWDIKRGANVYRQVSDKRLKSWVSTGKIKPGEAVVWRSNFSGWRRPEEVEELIPYFRHYEMEQLRKIESGEPAISTLPEKTQIKNILIIDDEMDLCQLFGDTLSSCGYNVKFAHTTKEALGSLKSQTPDLVFLDLKLPDGDGMKLLSKIREINPNTIVNIITAHGSEEARDEAKRLGAYDFIDKPFSEEDVIRCIREIQTN